MQQHLQFADFQAFEKATAPRSKFVKMALRVSVAKVSVLYSFGRSREMQENTTPSEGVQIKHVQHNEKSQWPFSDDLFLRGRYNVHALPLVNH